MNKPLSEEWKEKIGKIVHMIYMDEDLIGGAKEISHLLSEVKREGESQGMINAYKDFMRILIENKKKFPKGKKFELVADVRDVEKTLRELSELPNNKTER